MKPLLLFNHLSTSYDSLRANRMRTTLTVLGVTIGIASIVVILSLSAGATKIITNQVIQQGGTIAVVRPGTEETELQLSGLTSSLAGKQTASTLTEKDLQDIKNVDGVEAAAPLMLISGSVVADGKKAKTATIVATTPDLPKVTSLPLREGQFIDSVTNDDTAVVGTQLSVDLFGTEDSVGQTFRTYGTAFTVIGVLKRLDNPINYNNIDFDHAAIVSLKSGKVFNQDIASIQQIDILARSEAELPAVINEANKKLLINHFNEQNFRILEGDELSRPVNQFFSLVGATFAAIAAISLVVGGIGIMNIMLVNVSERTREIGIRKAIGASNGAIVWQFLTESLAMSLAGGLLGYLSGYVLAFTVARTFLTFNPVFNWQIVQVVFAVSIIVGLLFGLYPSIRAARKDPIDALRQYQ